MSSFFLLKLAVGHRRPFVANVNDSGIQAWVASDVVFGKFTELRESTMHVGEAVVITYVMDRKQVPGYTTKAQKFLNRDGP